MSDPQVLYIDDDPGLRRLAERALARRGFAVTTAADGATGAMLCGERAFDLVAVDHYMPGLDGLETLRRIAALPDPPPVVYVTGSEEGRIAVAAMKAGAADYVVKTVGEDFFDLLASAITNVLARAALERAKSAAEADLRASNARLEALLKEMNHRVANSLQLVSAMVSLQASALTGPARQALEDTKRRIAAVAQVHRRLYTSDDVESVDMQEYLGALVDELGETWCGEQRTLHLAADPIRLPTDRAVSLGVIVNELVSNACKYAYADTDGGEIRVELKREDDGSFVLAVEETGSASPTARPRAGPGLGPGWSRRWRRACNRRSNTIRATRACARRCGPRSTEERQLSASIASASSMSRWLNPPASWVVNAISTRFHTFDHSG